MLCTTCFRHRALNSGKPCDVNEQIHFICAYYYELGKINIHTLSHITFNEASRQVGLHTDTELTSLKKTFVSTQFELQWCFIGVQGIGIMQ